MKHMCLKTRSGNSLNTIAAERGATQYARREQGIGNCREQKCNEVRFTFSECKSNAGVMLVSSDNPIKALHYSVIAVLESAPTEKVTTLTRAQN